MTEPRASTAVTYIGLPIDSGGAHGLGTLGFRDAYEKTSAFIDACTVEISPRTQRFLFPDVPELEEKLEWKRDFRKRFGGWGRSEVRVSDDGVEAALSFLEEVDPQPQNPWGMAPLWFTTSWQIHLRDPATDEPYPGQDAGRFDGTEYAWRVPLGVSHVRLILSNKASLGIELCIPDLDDAGLAILIPALQEHAPFRFSAKQWRRWTPTTTGTFASRVIHPIV